MKVPACDNAIPYTLIYGKYNNVLYLLSKNVPITINSINILFDNCGIDINIKEPNPRELTQYKNNKIMINKQKI